MDTNKKSEQQIFVEAIVDSYTKPLQQQIEKLERKVRKLEKAVRNLPVRSYGPEK